jgi:DNA-3-methyladenine glycosylase II
VLLRTDVWPRGDLALANSMNHVFGVSVKSTDAAFMEMAEAWRPWRAVAARLLWRHYLSDDYERDSRRR